MYPIKVPSGAIYNEHDFELLKGASAVGSVMFREKPFRLSSGIESNVYVYCRGELTDNPTLLDMFGRKIARTVVENTVDGDHQANLIGLPTAGTALAIAASMASVQMNYLDSSFPLIASRVMREKVKVTHGVHDQWVNGSEPESCPPNLERFTYWAIDNVATNGKTKFELAERLEENGYPSKDMPQLIFIDRQQGAVARLGAAGFKRVVVCYLLLDITYVFGELGLWPKDAVKRVEEEIAAHQFL